MSSIGCWGLRSWILSMPKTCANRMVKSSSGTLATASVELGRVGMIASAGVYQHSCEYIPLGTCPTSMVVEIRQRATICDSVGRAGLGSDDALEQVRLQRGAVGVARLEIPKRSSLEVVTA